MANILVCGRRKEGKTTLARYLALQRARAVVAFDPRGMIQGLVVYGPDELEAAIEHGIPEGEIIVYRFDESDANEAFEEMAEILFPPRFTRGGFALIVDEAGQVQTFASINKSVNRAIRQHPTEGPDAVTIVQTFHRLPDVHGASKSLMNELYIFRTTNPTDLKQLSEYTDDNREIQEVVKKLPQHHCVRYLFDRQPEGEPDFYIWSRPEVWYSGATNQSENPEPQESEPEKGNKYFKP